MDITLVVFVYFHIFVLETAYIEYAHRKKIYELSDRIHILSIVKFASFLPLVMGVCMLFYHEQAQKSFAWISLGIGFFAVSFFMTKVFPTEQNFRKYLPLTLINVVFLLWVILLFEQQKQGINLFYPLSTGAVCLVYFFHLLDSKEKRENAILYIICILLSLSNLLLFPVSDPTYSLMIKAFTSGLLYLAIHSSILSQHIRQDKIHQIEANKQQQELEQAWKQIDVITEIDSLTGLENAKALEEYLSQISGSSDMEFALILINIKNFKDINNVYGRSEGDQVLVQMAKFLKEVTDGQYPVYRFTADQFGILQKGNRKDAENLAAGFLFSDKTLSFNNHKLSFHIGISLFEKGMDYERLYQQAEIALTEAKRRGKNRYYIFEENLTKKVNRKFTLEKLIQQRIAEEEFILYCQPKIDMETNKIVGGEILSKMLDEQGDFVPPNSFVRLAEDVGIIDEIDEVILKKSLRFIKHLEDLEMNIPISVNMSPQSFLKYDFVDKINQFVDDVGINRKHLIIEITENSLLTNINMAMQTSKKLRESGIALSLDDFGTGYSSLSYLVNLPVNEVKIDRSLVTGLVLGQRNVVFLSKLLELLMVMDLEIVIEGIETKTQLNQVRNCGGRIYQGYYAYKPVILEDYVALLEKENDEK